MGPQPCVRRHHTTEESGVPVKPAIHTIPVKDEWANEAEGAKAPQLRQRPAPAPASRLNCRILETRQQLRTAHSGTWRDTGKTGVSVRNRRSRNRRRDSLRERQPPVARSPLAGTQHPDPRQHRFPTSTEDYGTNVPTLRCRRRERPGGTNKIESSAEPSIEPGGACTAQAPQFTPGENQ